MPKPCKGNYRCDYFEGCGTTANNPRKYGLCPSCLYQWTKTEKGSAWFEKNKLKTVKKFEHEKKVKKGKEKIALMSKSAYWSKVLQPNINLIARLIDKGQPCIATGNNYGQMHGGHYTSVGSNLTLSLNLHNIHIQSAHSNKWKAGDDKNYRKGLINIYGLDYLEFVEDLEKCPNLNITKHELIEVNNKAKEIIKELKKNDAIKQPMSRILERNRVNLLLGVYTYDYSVF